jgi:hypothetical protein
MEKTEMNYRSLLTSAGILAMVGAASAETANFSRIVPSSDTIIVNQTAIYSSAWTTPLVFFLFVATIGILMLFASIVLKPETPYDMIGYIAPVPLAFATIMLVLGIDIKTSSGLGGLATGTATKLLMIENHTIYQPWLLFIFMLVLTGISIINILRILNVKAEGLTGSEE